MKRWIGRILVFLLIGAVINIAAAWACVAWAPIKAGGGWPAGWPADRRWPVEVPDDWPQPVFSFEDSVYAGWGVRYLEGECGTLRDMPPSSLTFIWQHWAAGRTDGGWPLPSLSAHRVSFTSSDTPVATLGEDWVGGLHVAIVRSRPFITNSPLPLPYRPLWPGFLLNTSFWGGLLLLLLVGIPSARQMYRRRRALCPACAYPVGTSPLCTECGRPVQPRSAAPA